MTLEERISRLERDNRRLKTLLLLLLIAVLAIPIMGQDEFRPRQRTPLHRSRSLPTPTTVKANTIEAQSVIIHDWVDGRRCAQLSREGLTLYDAYDRPALRLWADRRYGHGAGLTVLSGVDSQSVWVGVRGSTASVTIYEHAPTAERPIRSQLILGFGPSGKPGLSYWDGHDKPVFRIPK